MVLRPADERRHGSRSGVSSTGTGSRTVPDDDDSPLPPAGPFLSTWGPLYGPILRADEPPALGVVSAPDQPIPIGIAFPVGPGGTSQGASRDVPPGGRQGGAGWEVDLPRSGVVRSGMRRRNCERRSEAGSVPPGVAAGRVRFSRHPRPCPGRPPAPSGILNPESSKILKSVKIVQQSNKSFINFRYKNIESDHRFCIARSAPITSGCPILPVASRASARRAAPSRPGRFRLRVAARPDLLVTNLSPISPGRGGAYAWDPTTRSTTR